MNRRGEESMPQLIYCSSCKKGPCHHGTGNLKNKSHSFNNLLLNNMRNGMSHALMMKGCTCCCGYPLGLIVDCGGLGIEKER
jgi:hypothetical protein